MAFPPGIYGSLAFSKLNIVNRTITDNFSVDNVILINVNALEIMNGMMIITDGNVYNSKSYNGVVIYKHGSRHNFNGADPLIPGENADIQPLSNTAALGTSDKIPRADHVHYHGILSGGVLHSVATPSVSGFMSSIDKSKLDFFINPSNVIPYSIGSVSSPGIAINYSRSDHVHYHDVQQNENDHEIATLTTNGFMSKQDKQLLNALTLSGSVLVLNGSFNVLHPILCLATGSNIVNIPENINFELNGTYYSNVEINGIIYSSGYNITVQGCYRIQLNPVIYFPISDTEYSLSILINYSYENGKTVTSNSGFNITTMNIIYDINLNPGDIVTIVFLHTNGGPSVATDISINNKLNIIKLS